MDLWLRQKTSSQILINVLTVRVDFDVFRLRDYLGAGVGGTNESHRWPRESFQRESQKLRNLGELADDLG
jgi:hypothetical protein